MTTSQHRYGTLFDREVRPETQRLRVRPGPTGDVHVLAIDHRWQMEDMVDAAGADRSNVVRLKHLLYESFEQVASTRSDVGILIDDTYGHELLERATGRGLWLARALDVPRSRPVEFGGGPDVSRTLRSWPADEIAKLMVYAHPDDPAVVADQQWERLAQLTQVAVALERSFLVEFQAPAGVVPGPGYMGRLLIAAYERGITPDWWKLPPIADPHEWGAAAAIIAEHDPTCHGMLVLGQTAEPAVLAAAFGAAAAEPKVRGFAIGRAIFGAPATRWLEEAIDDATLVTEVAERFLSTISTWKALR